MIKFARFKIIFCLIFMMTTSSFAQLSPIQQLDDANFLPMLILMRDKDYINEAIERLDENWEPHLIPILLESAVLALSPRMRKEIYKLLKRNTDQNFGDNNNRWFQWYWNQPPVVNDAYADFKADLYVNVDPKFETYFRDRAETAKIRLDEILWGGIK